MTTIPIIRRDDVNISVTVKNNGVAMNITGYTVFFTVKKRIEDLDANALISKTVTSHTNPTQGITAVSLSHTDTDITPGNYYYDFQIAKNGVVQSTQRGIFAVEGDITQRTS